MKEPVHPAPDAQSFGEALAELDRIVAELEGGQLELEESLSQYERGVALLRALQGKLADAQQKVTMLMGELASEDDELGGDSGVGPSSAGPVAAAATTTDEEVPF